MSNRSIAHYWRELWIEDRTKEKSRCDVVFIKEPINIPDKVGIFHNIGVRRCWQESRLALKMTHSRGFQHFKDRNMQRKRMHPLCVMHIIFISNSFVEIVIRKQPFLWGKLTSSQNCIYKWCTVHYGKFWPFSGKK